MQSCYWLFCPPHSQGQQEKQCGFARSAGLSLALNCDFILVFFLKNGRASRHGVSTCPACVGAEKEEPKQVQGKGARQTSKARRHRLPS